MKNTQMLSDDLTYPVMEIAAGVGEVMEGPVEGPEIGVVTFNTQTGNRVSKKSKIFSHFGAGEAEEEGLIVGDDFMDTLERKRLMSKANNVGVGEGLP